MKNNKQRNKPVIKGKTKNKNKQQNHESSNSKLKIYIWPLLIAIFTLVLYMPSLDNDFTNWDDPTYVLENQMITDISTNNIKNYFTTPVSLNYHPLTMISLGIDYKIASTLNKKTKDNLYPGLNAKTYHTTNLLFHILSTILVFFFIYSLSGKKIIIASIVALLFGIHPMHIESVAWISERKDVLYTFFYLASLILYLKYLKDFKTKYLVYAFLIFILSILSKAVAVTLPVIFVIIDLYNGRKIDKRFIIEKIPFFIVSLIFGIVAYNIQSDGAIAKEGVISLFQKVVFASYGFITYIYKIFVPLDLAAFYPYPSLKSDGSLPGYFLVMPFLVVAILSSVIIFFKKNKVLFFGIAFYLVTIILVLQLISVGRAVMAERYTYVPYIGIFFILAYYFNSIFENKNKKLVPIKYIISIALVGFIGWLSFLTSKQIKVWENSGTLWTNTINSFPNADVAYKNRGNYYGQLNQPDKAMDDYNILIANNQVDDQVWGNIGNIHRMRNLNDKAFEAYSNQINMAPNKFKGYINRGITYSILKNYPPAFDDFNKALELGAPFRSVAINRAYTYLYAGDYNNAIKDFDFLIKENPYDINLYKNRGLAKFNLKNFDAAINDFNLALKVSPNDGSLFYNISVCFLRKGDNIKAADYVVKAQKAGYQVPQAYLSNFNM